jgi:dipeptidase E
LKTPKRQIIAIGGGGITVNAAHPGFERYILSQARRRNPRVCFVATATGDAASTIALFYAAYAKHLCRLSHVSFFERTPNLREQLLGQDVIYVGGGNTKSMLAVWREWKLPSILKQAWQSGAVLAGVSAGAICWFQQGVTDSWASGLRPLPCLGWLPGACCPHYDSEMERRPTTHDMVKKGLLSDTLALEDGTAAHFVGRHLLRVVSTRPAARAYSVRRRNGHAVETALPVKRLNKDATNEQ